ncbi:hypothetical protein [Candidatus Pelagibacter sp.]|uniref:hypothetical protein n=1 Tax=Candidatus Pelagibacter sp. TaxID=2024849 RepID=UPI003F824B99
MIDYLKYKLQKGLSIVEGMTAAAILGASMTVFMTLQSTQEQDFSTLRKFDKAAYAVELMFEELAAVYQPIATQYGNPQVAEDTTAGTQLKAKGFSGLPKVGDEIIITGVGGKYEITARTVFDGDQNTTLTLDRSDVADTNIVNMAADAALNANITIISNAQGSLDPYHSLDLTRHEDAAYIEDLEDDDLEKVALDLQNWGALLETHLGPARDGDIREIAVEDITKNVPLDLDNDGVTDTDSEGDDIIEQVKKKQVTITIKQDNIEERFRRLFLSGT